METNSFEREFTRKRPNYKCILNLMREALDVEEVQWNHLTRLNLSRIVEHIQENVSSNSACTYIAVIRAFISCYAEEGIVPCKKPENILKSKKVPSEQVVLNAEEISLIEAYQPKTEHEKWVKAQFLCEYYCMARTSDIQALTEDNIKDGYITYVSKKTKTLTSVPLHKNFLTYFRQRGETLHLMVFNRILKRICKEVGICEQVKLFYHGKEVCGPKYIFVASHTARRSAASELASRNVPISVISQFMNHAGRITTTQRYIYANTRNLDEKAMSFFE